MIKTKQYDSYTEEITTQLKLSCPIVSILKANKENIVS